MHAHTHVKIQKHKHTYARAHTYLSIMGESISCVVTKTAITLSVHVMAMSIKWAIYYLSMWME